MGGKWWRRLLLILLSGQCPRLGGHFPDPSNPPPQSKRWSMLVCAVPGARLLLDAFCAWLRQSAFPRSQSTRQSTGRPR